MKLKDLEEIVNIHLNSFQNFFLSFLGLKFLIIFYKGVISSPLGVGFVYIDNNRIEGFICGTISPSDFFQNLLKKKWFHFSIASLGAILKKPTIILRLLRAISLPSSSLKGDKKATLMSIGINPQAQGKGLGKILVQNFLKELKSKGIYEVNLTTDRLNNKRINQFYKKLGFTLKRYFTTPEDREMNEYIIKL